MRNIVLALIGALLSALVAMPGAQAQTPSCPGLSIVPCTIQAAIPATPSTALEASHVLKASAGTLYSVKVVTTTTAGWLLIFNATSAPADGAVTPIDFYQVGASTFLDVAWPTPLAANAGLTVVFSTTGPFTKTGSATAAFSAQVQ